MQRRRAVGNSTHRGRIQEIPRKGKEEAEKENAVARQLVYITSES